MFSRRSYGVLASQRKASFDPLTDLPGLAWFLHPDDATDIVAGEINSIPDRVAAVSFAANFSTQRMALSTTERPGHQVASSQSTTPNADWLRAADATLAQSVGGGELTFFALCRFEAESNHSIVTHSNSTAGNGDTTQCYRLNLQTGPSRIRFFARDTAGTSTYAWTASEGYAFSTSWRTIAVTQDSSGTCEAFLDGASLGTQAGTLRLPTGMTGAHYGGGASTAVGHFSAAGACVGALDAATIGKLHNWLMANA